MQNQDQQRFWTQDAGPSWVTRMDAMDQTLAPVLDEVLRVAHLESGEHVVDIGCGAGTSTLAAARMVGPSGHVHGVDISRTLLDAAEARAAGKVAFTLADAQTHAFPAAAYDVLISRFGVMFFEDTKAAFSNMANALKPGGRMVFATWGAIPENPFFTMPAKVATEIIGKAPKGDPDAPGPLALRDLSLVTDILKSAGTSEVTATEVPMMLTPAGSAEEVADLLCDIGSAQRVLEHFGSGPADRARLCTALAAALEEYQTPQGIRIPSLINIFTARKPA